MVAHPGPENVRRAFPISGPGACGNTRFREISIRVPFFYLLLQILTKRQDQLGMLTAQEEDVDSVRRLKQN